MPAGGIFTTDQLSLDRVAVAVQTLSGDSTIDISGLTAAEGSRPEKVRKLRQISVAKKTSSVLSCWKRNTKGWKTYEENTYGSDDGYDSSYAHRIM